MRASQCGLSRVPASVRPRSQGADADDIYQLMRESYPDLVTPRIRAAVIVEAAYTDQKPFPSIRPGCSRLIRSDPGLALLARPEGAAMSQAIDRSDARAGEDDATAEDVVRRRSSRIPIASQCDAAIWGSVRATVRGMMNGRRPGLHIGGVR